jgi:hypothetical protein
MTLDEQQQGLDEAHATIKRMRDRMAAARKRGGVELHVSLDEVATLVQFANVAVVAYKKKLAAEKAKCTVSEDGLCYPEQDGHCHWCDRKVL